MEKPWHVDVLVCPTAKLWLHWLTPNRPNWLPFKPPLTVAHELRSRNQNRNAGRRAEELARKLDDPDDWAKKYRSYHLGEKLIALAVRFACFDGQPIFE